MIPSGEAGVGRPDASPVGPPSGDLYSFPVSIAQRRFWLLDRLDPGNPAYNIAVRFRLKGPLDYPLTERAFNEIVRRHEVLRTSFDLNDGEPVQLIHPDVAIKVPVVDLRPLPEPERNLEAERLAVVEARARFDLGTAPLIRVGLLRIADEEHILLITVHHIVADGWSIGVITNELGAIYDALAQGRESPLPELPIQYADFTLWQRERVEKNPFEREASYWKGQLRDLPELAVPPDHPRPEIQTHEGNIVSILLPQSLTDALRDLSVREGATLFMTMLAAFEVLLHRHTGQTDIVVGSPIAGRNRVEIEPLIGVFINTLVLRTDLSGNPGFLELLKRANETVTQAFAHQDIPFEHLVEVLRVKRDVSRNPLFQVNFIYQRDFIKPLHFARVTLTAVPSKSPGAIVDLNFFLVERAEGWRFSCEYNTVLYAEATARRMLGHFRSLLESIAANPRSRISNLTLLSPAERHQVLVEWNQSKREYPRDRCVHELFEAQAARTPDAVALIFGGQRMTYRELNGRANQLARHLRGLGVRPDSLVGVAMERSLDMIVAILGALKAGGAYVPLDPAYPSERFNYMLQDARAPVLLTQEKWVIAHELRDGETRILCLDRDWNTIAGESAENPPPAATPDNLVYVIYTSGSTGRPKATGVYHRGFTNLVHWYATEYALSPDDCAIMVGSLSFDLTQKGIFGPLIRGARLCILPSGPYDPAAIGQLIETHRVTIINCTPSAFYPLVDPPVSQALERVASLRWITVGGEPIALSRLKPWLASPGCHAAVANNYGPTECSDISAAYHFTRETMDRHPFVPIGRPIYNASLVIVDAQFQPVPIGVPGELFIGGDGVGAGYLNNSELTAAKFIPNPFPEISGARVYRTGDLCRYLPDGNIEFLGRIDQQVKIRGFRIELEEIEAVIRQHPAVLEAAVTARGQEGGDKQLVAYLVGRPGATPDIVELRNFLKARLPDYMVPGAFKTMDAFPLTPSGKLDRRALPAPDQAIADADPKFAFPSTPIEELLAEVWAGLLHLPRVGVHDNFFELGGNSLLTMQVIDRINNAGLHITPTQFFQHQTIADLAAVVSTKSAVSDHETNWSSLVTLQPHGSRPPFYLVHTLPGDVLGYMELVRALGHEQPCYGFQANGLGRKEDSHHTFEEMAAHYVRLMREFQPRGPYFLGGWCFGGNIAAEMALQLVAQGQQVALLALIETWAYPPRLSYYRFYLNQFGCFLKLGPRSMLRHVGKRLARAVRPRVPSAAAHDEFAFASVQSGPFKNREFIHQINVAAMKKYRFSPYPGKITLFEGNYRQPGEQLSLEARWTTLARTLEVFTIPGGHRSLIKEPGVRILAEKLKICLANAQNAAR